MKRNSADIARDLLASTFAPEDVDLYMTVGGPTPLAWSIYEGHRPTLSSGEIALVRASIDVWRCGGGPGSVSLGYLLGILDADRLRALAKAIVEVAE